MVVTDGEQTTEADFSMDGVANQSTNSTDAWSYNPANFGLAGAPINTGFGARDNLSPYGFLMDSRPFGTSYSSFEHLKDELVKMSDAACAEVKRNTGGRNIEIFTIGISSDTRPGTRADTALANCASKPDNHFYAQDSAALERAMDSILESAKTLRLTH